MALSESTALLRPGLLEGISLLVAGAVQPAARSSVAPSSPAWSSADSSDAASSPSASFAGAVRGACTELGAHARMCAPDAVEEASVDQMVDDAVAELGSLEMLVVDGAGLFTHGAAGGATADRALRACLDTAWNITRAVVNRAFLQSEPSSHSRRIVYLAPAANAGKSAGAARAGLENLSRTLSTEWARHGITVVTIAPGETTAAGEVAALCAYLASPAGAYFSGCLLDLRGV
jgi:NAD(P)-dependent dehydrogenase (short-subunit alcohol dehydrogenase family)